jgi:hypothetical protein
MYQHFTDDIKQRTIGYERSYALACSYSNQRITAMGADVRFNRVCSHDKE